MQQLMISEQLEESLILKLSKEWQQEDIQPLIQQLLSLIPELSIVEKIIGADRENYRLLWQNSHYVLNFEVYSQSVWLEQEGENNKSLFNQLVKVLS